MFSIDEEKKRNKAIQNDKSVSNSNEHWKTKFPGIFEKIVCIKLNRLKLNSLEPPESVIEMKKRNFESIDKSDLVRVTRSRKKRNFSVDWVRISNGHFKGDIAKVEFLNEKENEVHLKLFPRIDYDSLALNRGLEKLPSKRRPPLGAFDPNAIR